MGCGTWLWLLVSLGHIWGRTHGVREMVLGTLGKRTMLRVPPELQDLTMSAGEAVWRRDTEDPGSKMVLLKYLNGHFINYMKGWIHFHEVNFSLEILNTTRRDRQCYEYMVTKGPEQKVWQIQLEVYEPVANPSIQLLRQDLANGSCTITLNCTAEQGDNISYTWGTHDPSTLGLCSGTGSLLHLSYPLQNRSISCLCNATNPVSSWLVTFNTSGCSSEQGGSARLRMEHLVLLVAVPVAAVLLLTILVGARWAVPLAPAADQQHQDPPAAQQSPVHTIYSQVQRLQKPKGIPTTEHPSCTPIYTPASGQPLDSAPSTGHVPQPQSPSKEPSTVYASVMLPMA
ncbi:signaling lymphocytic activation molecule-like [Heliangelus exortis]|uniref:signaling lymphocytic activation molecule-like n=1 Tax=Heliangelus exortis TaxID=472823 RepID=UPI003A929BF8